jgi:hypothetical protein
MITLQLARQLKSAGLKWRPEIHDFFAIPERGMDSRVFVVSDMHTNIEVRFGQQVVAFQGASEWALDYLVASEVVWLPGEAQLRVALENVLTAEEQPALKLTCRPGWCWCAITYRGEPLVFEAQDASDAYGETLLHILTAS